MTADVETQTPTRTPRGPALLVDAALTRLLRLPPLRTAFRVERDLPATMRDGVVLLGDHYAPLTPPARGTVLVRTPYGRGFPGDLLDARALAARGYHVVFQSCRGTFGSGGEFDPMVHEADDAQDTVAWLRRQPWFDGRLATLGGSYMGWVQWALLLDPPPELRTAVVLIGPHDMGGGVVGTGAFTLNDLLWWSEMVAHQEQLSRWRGLVRAATIGRRLAPVYSELPLADAAARLLEHGAPWFRTWLSHPDRADPFWDRLDAAAALQRVSVPVRLVGGWQDVFLTQTVHQYEVLHRRGVDVGLTVGPWAHLEVGTRGAGWVVRGNLGWLDEHLAGGAWNGRAPVEVYVTGAGRWRSLPQWPPRTTALVRYLQPGGRLTAEEPSGAGPSTSFYYDPADPTPTVGGRLLTPDAGVRDNNSLEARPDVLTFTSPPLTAAVEIVGTPVVELVLSRDNPFADVSLRLCDVDAKGRSRNFSDGFLRLDATSTPNEAVRVDDPAGSVRAPPSGRAPAAAPGVRRVASALRPQRGDGRRPGHGDGAPTDHPHRASPAGRGLARGAPDLAIARRRLIRDAA